MRIYMNLVEQQTTDIKVAPKDGTDYRDFSRRSIQENEVPVISEVPSLLRTRDILRLVSIQEPRLHKL